MRPVRPQGRGAPKRFERFFRPPHGDQVFTERKVCGGVLRLGQQTLSVVRERRGDIAQTTMSLGAVEEGLAEMGANSMVRVNWAAASSKVCCLNAICLAGSEAAPRAGPAWADL